MSAPSDIRGFDAAAFGPFAAADPAGARAAAFARYAALPLPAPDDEDWRHTPLARFPFGRLAPWAPLGPPSPAAATGDDWAVEFDLVITVSGAGARVEDRSGLLAARRLGFQALETCPEERSKPWNLPGPPGAAEKIEALNAAFFTCGWRLDIPAAAELARGALVRYVHDRSGIFLPRLAVRVGPRARFALVEWYENAAGAEGFLVGATQWTLAEGARAEYARVTLGGVEGAAWTDDRARLARDAALRWTTAQIGGRLNRARAGAALEGPGAEFVQRGLCRIGGTSRHERRTIQLHAASDTNSNLLHKAVVADEAQSVYRGVIAARPGAVRIDAYQKNNNLVLDPGARATSMPGLLIDADDLKCTHGATIGSLDPEQVFYLRARGLDEAAARRLLLEGFYEDILAAFPHESLRARLRRALADGAA